MHSQNLRMGFGKVHKKKIRIGEYKKNSNTLNKQCSI